MFLIFSTKNLKRKQSFIFLRTVDVFQEATAVVSSLGEPVVEILAEPEHQSGPPSRHNSGHSRTRVARTQEEVRNTNVHFTFMTTSISV